MLREIKKKTLSNNKMSFPVQYGETFEELKNKLEPLKGLEKGDKIGKDNDGNYIIYKSGYLQTFWRNYYQEDRTKTIEYLKNDFETYSAFLDNVLIEAESDLLNILKEFSYKVSDYSQKIIKRLYNLKGTYKNDNNNKEIIARIDSIILVLIDFKDKIQRIYENKNLAHMSLYLRSDRLNDRLTKSL